MQNPHRPLPIKKCTARKQIKQNISHLKAIGEKAKAIALRSEDDVIQQSLTEITQICSKLIHLNYRLQNIRHARV